MCAQGKRASNDSLMKACLALPMTLSGYHMLTLCILSGDLRRAPRLLEVGGHVNFKAGGDHEFKGTYHNTNNDNIDSNSNVIAIIICSSSSSSSNINDSYTNHTKGVPRNGGRK